MVSLMDKKKKIKKIIFFIIEIICVCVLVFSAYKIVMWKLNTDRNKDIKEEVNSYVEEKETEVLEEKYNIDFAALKAINPDVVAWIKIYGIDVEYPVVKGNDNEFYLNHNLKKEKNSGGWLFADYTNKFDGYDKNIVIYGHNMKDGSMFGKLKKVLWKEWQDDEKNLKIIFIDETGTNIYEVFSTYSYKAEDYYITTSFESDAAYSSFLKTIKSRSNHNYGIKLSTDDTILTLSSCLNDNRVVLHARKITSE